MPESIRRTVHRVGGGSVENLRLKPKEETLKPPGISVLVADGPEVASRQMVEAFSSAPRLVAAAGTVGSTTPELIRAAGFDIISVPTRNFPNHHRIVHPDGVAGFTDENLGRLAAAFVETTGDDL